MDAIVVGSITQFGNDNQNTKVGGGGGGWGGYGLGGFSHKKSKAVVVVDARLVNIDTAEIMGVATGKGESCRESTSMLGGGSNWHGFGGGAVDFGSSDFQNTIIGEATNAAVIQMTEELVADNTKLEARTITVEGFGGRGRRGPGRAQRRVKVRAKSWRSAYRAESDERDQGPIDRPVIRRMTSPVGVIRLTDVDEISAVGTPVSGSGFKVGDAVKTITQ